MRLFSGLGPNLFLFSVTTFPARENARSAAALLAGMESTCSATLKVWDKRSHCFSTT